jgi:hypothetical protein
MLKSSLRMTTERPAILAYFSVTVSKFAGSTISSSSQSSE